MEHKELLSLINYNPETGIFTSKISRRGVKINRILGYHKESGYIIINIKRKRYYAHRLAWFYMTGKIPANQIDHLNHIRDDNKWNNLRECTHMENHRNLPRRATNSSGTTGVSWARNNNKWVSTITVNYKTIYLGIYSNIQDAIKSRKEAEIRYVFHINHGKDTKVNKYHA